MTVRRQIDLQKTAEVIQKGGKTVDESKAKGKDLKYTLRVPKALMEKIDEKINANFGILSRNDWILQAIVDKLEK